MAAQLTRANFSNIKDKLTLIRQETNQIAQASGYVAPQIVLVSKYYDDADSVKLHQLAIAPLGENRVQQLSSKQNALAQTSVTEPVHANWHFIGHLQRNKVAAVYGKVEWIHSLDSERLALAFNQCAEQSSEAGAKLLIQINISGESSKGGLSPALAVNEIPRWIEQFPQLQICGLMTMPPPGDHDSNRPFFRELREMRDQIRAQLAPDKACLFTELSMGMSSDYRGAVAEGATWIRLGQVLNS